MIMGTFVETQKVILESTTNQFGKLESLVVTAEPSQNMKSSAQGISGLVIIDGADALPPQGYSKLDLDLNKGSGGAFLYLCYQFGTTSITDLSVKNTGSSGEPRAPSLFKFVKDQNNEIVDMNRGAGGDFIWLSYISTPNDNPITKIGLMASTRDDQPIPSGGWTKLDYDLNAGARGWWIYLIAQGGPFG
jgi:hypothetical protein